ncbi:hypothetical protein C7B80_00340 [Cyanosarcina cf. burmensis CCALA 770]|nr:hypothetical protein C7B80_00340 [Cyanosarcina cf. burmensis CCALA 770]
MSTNENIQAVVSVVIPSRNRPQLVSRAVKSALAQTYKAIEVIVIVDGSNRDTVQAIKEINNFRLRVIEPLVNVEPSGARNTGVREAKGTWIAFLVELFHRCVLLFNYTRGIHENYYLWYQN